MFGLFRKKSDHSSLFEGKVDSHCHILWGVDDGARNREEGQAMVDGLKRLGFRGGWCTPHIMASTPLNTPDYLRERFDDARQLLDLEGFDLRLAAEYMMDEQFLDKVEHGPLLTYDGKHVLVEFSQMSLPRNWRDILFQIRIHDYVPVLAHPERYCHILSERELLTLLDDDIVEFQLTISSLHGVHGKNVQKLARKLFETDKYTWWGTDVHRPGHVASLGKIAPRDLRRLEQIR